MKCWNGDFPATTRQHFGSCPTGGVSFHRGPSGTHHKPLDYDITGLGVNVGEAVLAGDLRQVAKVDLHAVVHRHLHLCPR